MKQTISLIGSTLSKNNMSITSRIANSKVIVALAELYSALLEEQVSPMRTLRIINVQLAIFALCLTANFGIAPAALCLAWVAQSIYACKDGSTACSNNS